MKKVMCQLFFCLFFWRFSFFLFRHSDFFISYIILNYLVASLSAEEEGTLYRNELSSSMVANQKVDFVFIFLTKLNGCYNKLQSFTELKLQKS